MRSKARFMTRSLPERAAQPFHPNELPRSPMPVTRRLVCTGQSCLLWMDNIIAEAAVAVDDAVNGLVHLFKRKGDVLEH